MVITKKNKRRISTLILSAMVFLMVYACNSKNVLYGKKYSSSDHISTDKYKGHFYYSVEGDSGAFGSLLIYPETDTTFLFYIEANRGAPSYNSGAMYNRAHKIEKGLFKAKSQVSDCSCMLKYSKDDKSFLIETPCNGESFGFGANVPIAARYKQQNDAIQEYFVTRTNDTIFFKEVSPEYFYDGYYY